MSENRDKLSDVYKKRAALSGRYSLENPGNRFNFEWLYGRIRANLNSTFDDLEKIRMLDLGAGELFWTEQISRLGFAPENCYGSDLLFWRLANGRRKGRSIDAVTTSAASLSFRSSSFDLVCQLTMMTSVLDSDIRKSIAREMVRVLRPGGYILWYDFRYNNPFNAHTRAIGKAELEGLFEGLTVRYESITLFPQLARKIGPIIYPLLKFAAALPILRTHYLALIGPKG